MNAGTVDKIFNQTCPSSEIAGALKRLIEVARQKQKFEALFQQKSASSLELESHSDSLQGDLGLLVASGIVDQIGDTIRSCVMIHENPHIDLTPNIKLDPKSEPVYIMTDWPDVSLDAEQPFCGEDMVFPLHYESFALLEQLVEAGGSGGKSVLDMCCGSGVLGIYAVLLGAKSVHFVDLCERSLAFAKVNAAMAGIADAAFITSNLFSRLPTALKWDVILTNPPFEPVPAQENASSPSKYFRHSNGGPDGQKVMNEVLLEAPNRLTESGIILAVDFLLLPDDSEQNKEELRKIASQWASGSHCGRLVVYGQEKLSDFWHRLDALGLDPDRNGLQKLMRDGRSHLALCTLELSIRAKDAVSIKPSIPPVYWLNPLLWSLPCGIQEDERRELDSLWRADETEKVANGSAILAERLASNGGSASYWDLSAVFEPARVSTDNNLTESLRTTFYESLHHAQELVLRGAVTARAASLIVLPDPKGSPDQGQPFYVLETTKEPVRNGPGTPKRGCEKKSQSQCEALIAEWFSLPGLLFRFWLKAADPGSVTSDYSQIADSELWLTGLANGRHSSRMTADILRRRGAEVQAYVLRLGLSKMDLKALTTPPRSTEKYHRALQEQLFRFMRDRMTILAISLIVLQQKRAELAKRNFDEAAMTAHILGTTISSIRGKLLFESSTTANEIRYVLDDMDHYRHVLRRMFRGEMGTNTRSSIAALKSKIKQTADKHELKCEWIEETILGDTVVDVNNDYLEVVLELCCSNVKCHGKGQEIKLTLRSDSGKLVCDFFNQVNDEKLQALATEVPFMNEGTMNALGIHTLHLACGAWLRQKPKFAFLDESSTFVASIPLTDYADH